jgi:hypothetical protein
LDQRKKGRKRELTQEQGCEVIRKEEKGKRKRDRSKSKR